MSISGAAAARRRGLPIVAPTLAVLLGLLVSGCGINKIPTLEEHASAGVIYAIQLAGFVLALALLSPPRLRFHLVPRAIQHARAHLTAMRQFAAQGLHTSPDRTGVLIFAAQAERYATVIADEGIHGKVDPDTWNGAVDILIAAIKDGRPADGFVGAVERCGAVLAEHFPRAPGAAKAEDLPDKLVEI